MRFPERDAETYHRLGKGADLMWKYCAQAARSGEAVYFYGSSFETLRRMSVNLQAAFPALHIGGVYSLPFRAEGEIEEDAIIAFINESGAGVVFVGLGCPKQEKWMAVHQNRIHAVMIGVGAAFDYDAGTVQRAPVWMQRNGLEWSYRLLSDPRRLWKRYLVTNTLFIIRASLQLLPRAFRNVNFPPHYQSPSDLELWATKWGIRRSSSLRRDRV